ncbi:NUDIX hydrolase [Roseibacillus ishigakijimensis]|uniref:NUDIX hydrolase n=1 Tax=Roseibacillus ishigakijimensis TaxID=454146 RepID=A0A934RRX6_9BACT|nr:NUDIX hydrolase [Roseibacillus ishigakijimensis]MBK1833130.1 NUDIX hydrolase [Roseibacillus ishigakijimensis]
MDALHLARELEALAQSGLHYGKDPYDRERYERLLELSGELMTGLGTLTREQLHHWRAEDFGYATPKIDVRAFCLRDGKVMLVSEKADGGRWALPGGWADVNQSAAESVAREVHEESGFEVEVRQLLAVWDREKQGNPPPYPYSIYKMFFLCEIIGGEARETMETAGVEFFAREELPVLSEARVMASQIERCFAKVAQEDLTTDFD